MNAKQVANLARMALLEELDTTPKPGLVDRADSGAHSDMDYTMFVRSTEAITPFFEQIFSKAEKCSDISLLLEEVRSIGVAAEKAMFLATNGTNTHKGALFCLGMVVAAYAYLQKGRKEITSQSLSVTISQMCSGICQRELNVSQPKTHGEQVFAQHRLAGARGQAEEGYKQVFFDFLPFFLQQMRENSDFNQAKIKTLLYIMSKVQDINVVFRHGEKQLHFAQMQAKALLQAFSLAGAEKLNRVFVQKGISGGGSADILTLVIFLEKLIY